MTSNNPDSTVVVKLNFNVYGGPLGTQSLSTRVTLDLRDIGVGGSHPPDRVGGSWGNAVLQGWKATFVTGDMIPNGEAIELDLSYDRALAVESFTA